MTESNGINNTIYDAVSKALENKINTCNTLLPSTTGKSTYDLAVDYGYVGTEREWLNHALNDTELLNNLRKDATDLAAYIDTIPSVVNDAINNTAVEGGILADTFVTATAKFGGISRLLSSKLSDVVSIKDFGAKDEDGFDNTAALQLAVDSGYKAIFIPSGTFYKSGNVIVPDDVTLFGVGESSVIKDTRTGVAEGFTITGSNITLGNFSLLSTGVGGVSTHITGSIAVRASTTGVDYDSIRIENLDIEGWGSGGILLSRCNNSYVRYCRIKHIGRYGVFIMGADNTHLVGNTIKHITAGNGGNAPFINAYGFSFTSDISEVGFPPCTNCSALFNYIEDIPNWEGMDIHGCDDILIAYNTVKNTMIGCYVGAASGLNNRTSKSVIISNNRFTTSTTYRRPAILVSPTYDVGSAYGNNIRVVDNFIEGYGTSTDTINAGYTSLEGAIHTIGVIGCQVLDNTLVNCNAYGIFVRKNCIGAFITGNTIRDMKTVSNQNWCIAVEDVLTTTVTVESNYLQRSTGVVSGITTLNTSTVVSLGTAGLTLGVNNFIGITQKYGTYTMKHSNSVSPELLSTKVHGFITNTGTAVITHGVNVASATRADAGIVDVVYAIPMQSSSSSVLVTPRHNTTAYGVVGSVTATGFRVYTYNKTNTLEDVSFIFSVM